jgi:hypothetical protein
LEDLSPTADTTKGKVKTDCGFFTAADAEKKGGAKECMDALATYNKDRNAVFFFDNSLLKVTKEKIRE